METASGRVNKGMVERAEPLQRNFRTVFKVRVTGKADKVVLVEDTCRQIWHRQFAVAQYEIDFSALQLSRNPLGRPWKDRDTRLGRRLEQFFR